ncbi:hypothetical protein GCM10009544_55050 [Streptomyces stramineus]|uniref:Uncharacterized protein n=1 Tax=Streptomyces stramineus TaxID=173861 RepID=A0ABN1AYR8_9ACTN
MRPKGRGELRDQPRCARSRRTPAPSGALRRRADRFAGPHGAFSAPEVSACRDNVHRFSENRHALPGLWADSSAERTGGATVPVTHTPRGSAAAERSRCHCVKRPAASPRALPDGTGGVPHRVGKPPLIGGGAS